METATHFEISLGFSSLVAITVTTKGGIGELLPEKANSIPDKLINQFHTMTTSSHFFKGKLYLGKSTKLISEGILYLPPHLYIYLILECQQVSASNVHMIKQN